MMNPSVKELVKVISHNSALVEAYLKENNLPLPSFDVDAPTKSLIPADVPEIEAARVAIIDSTLQLRDLMLGPKEHLMSFTHNQLISMQVITRFGMATTFGTHEEASFAEISEKCGINEIDVRRILRHAMTKRIFHEPRKGIVRHTAASRLLAEDSQIADWVGASTDELWQSASQTLNAMVKYPNSQELNETGYAVANNTELSMFQFLSSHPERARRFGNAMKAFVEDTSYDMKYVLEGLPWRKLGTSLVVDVGGSHGQACIALAGEFPDLKLIVQDLPPVVAAGASTLPLQFANKIEFMAHNFFTEQPAKNADVYFFRWIFHNWSDKYCVKILRNLVPALKHGAKIVINDGVLPEPGTTSNWQEDRLRSMDLTMLELQNSRERDLDDWARLFKDADPRFLFNGGHQPSGSTLWILEVTWDDSQLPN